MVRRPSLETVDISDNQTLRRLFIQDLCLSIRSQYWEQQKHIETVIRNHTDGDCVCLGQRKLQVSVEPETWIRDVVFHKRHASIFERVAN